jgi:hypothetical protein
MARDYSADFQKILDQISIDDVQGTETPAADLLNLNMSDSKGRRFNGQHLRGALRSGESAGYGSLIVGRRGYPTRFAWSKVPASVVAQASSNAKASKRSAAASAADAKPAAAAARPAAASTSGNVMHSLQLRNGTTVHLELPADLTTREAERLAYWVQALPFG